MVWESGPDEVKHIQVNGKYKFKITRAAGVKTGDGFEVEANGDDIREVEADAWALYDLAKHITEPAPAPQPEAKKE